MKCCIVFAVSIFSKEKLYVLREFLETFKEKFEDCDYFVGINYNSLPEVEEVIAEYKLNTKVSRVVSNALYCGSDASAYQAALKLLRNESKRYDLYWFAHTKGAVNHRPVERAMYLSEIFGERTKIEKLFAEHRRLGSYALRGVSSGAGGDQWAIFNRDHDIQICNNKKYEQFQYTHVNWSYIETIYVINKQPVETFLALTTDSFYETKITEPCYFEIIFPWIGSRCGYFPYIKYNRCFWGIHNLKNITKNWIEENSLQELNEYLAL